MLRVGGHGVHRAIGEWQTVVIHVHPRSLGTTVASWSGSGVTRVVDVAALSLAHGEAVPVSGRAAARPATTWRERPPVRRGRGGAVLGPEDPRIARFARVRKREADLHRRLGMQSGARNDWRRALACIGTKIT